MGRGQGYRCVVIIIVVYFIYAEAVIKIMVRCCTGTYVCSQQPLMLCQFVRG
jgi:hypothetical protein